MLLIYYTLPTFTSDICMIAPDCSSFKPNLYESILDMVKVDGLVRLNGRIKLYAHSHTWYNSAYIVGFRRKKKFGYIAIVWSKKPISWPFEFRHKYQQSKTFCANMHAVILSFIVDKYMKKRFSKIKIKREGGGVMGQNWWKLSRGNFCALLATPQKSFFS